MEGCMRTRAVANELSSTVEPDAEFSAIRPLQERVALTAREVE